MVVVSAFKVASSMTGTEDSDEARAAFPLRVRAKPAIRSMPRITTMLMSEKILLAFEREEKRIARSHFPSEITKRSTIFSVEAEVLHCPAMERRYAGRYEIRKKTKQALCYKLSLEYTKVGRAERLRFGDELVKIYMPRFS